eukprot:TRINITY_DN2219_c0_g1_i2.p2 TRINITY_DN2219_c0_g1~~TRINITY_DN2219_c0_g1_i2.p2  ORF type:complete len:117 (+),score=20.73 TRINITY_DN2219_c0_g1_i2:169-519(+)
MLVCCGVLHASQKLHDNTTDRPTDDRKERQSSSHRSAESQCSTEQEIPCMKNATKSDHSSQHMHTPARHSSTSLNKNHQNQRNRHILDEVAMGSHCLCHLIVTIITKKDSAHVISR